MCSSIIAVSERGEICNRKMMLLPPLGKMTTLNCLYFITQHLLFELCQKSVDGDMNFQLFVCPCQLYFDFKAVNRETSIIWLLTD